MTSAGEDTWPAQVRASLDRMQQELHDRLVFDLVLRGAASPEQIETVMREHLATATHDVQAYWFGDCNCHGQLN